MSASKPVRRCVLIFSLSHFSFCLMDPTPVPDNFLCFVVWLVSVFLTRIPSSSASLYNTYILVNQMMKSQHVSCSMFLFNMMNTIEFGSELGSEKERATKKNIVNQRFGEITRGEWEGTRVLTRYTRYLYCEKFILLGKLRKKWTMTMEMVKKKWMMSVHNA